MIDQLHSACAPLCYARKSLTPGKLGEAIAALVVGIAWEGGRYLGELRITEFERFESWSDGVCKIRRSIAQITAPATLAR